jgi:hypothetical protein
MTKPEGIGWFRTTDEHGQPGWGRYDGMTAEWKPDDLREEVAAMREESARRSTGWTKRTSRRPVVERNPDPAVIDFDDKTTFTTGRFDATMPPFTKRRGPSPQTELIWNSAIEEETPMPLDPLDQLMSIDKIMTVPEWQQTIRDRQKEHGSRWDYPDYQRDLDQLRAAVCRDDARNYARFDNPTIPLKGDELLIVIALMETDRAESFICHTLGLDRIDYRALIHDITARGLILAAERLEVTR